MKLELGYGFHLHVCFDVHRLLWHFSQVFIPIETTCCHSSFANVTHRAWNAAARMMLNVTQVKIELLKRSYIQLFYHFWFDFAFVRGIYRFLEDLLENRELLREICNFEEIINSKSLIFLRNIQHKIDSWSFLMTVLKLKYYIQWVTSLYTSTDSISLPYKSYERKWTVLKHFSEAPRDNLPSSGRNYFLGLRQWNSSH